MPTGYLLQGAFGLPGLPQQVQGANVQQVTEVGDFLLPWARVREPCYRGVRSAKFDGCRGLLSRQGAYDHQT